MVPEPEPRPMLVLNPADDADFESVARRLVEDGAAGDPDRLQAGLRDRWPLAIVRRRDLAGEQAQIWYVYRDGHWIRTGA